MARKLPSTKRRYQPPDDRVRLVVLEIWVQHAQQQQRHRLGEVKAVRAARVASPSHTVANLRIPP
jgi:hypothetical protein